MLLNFACLTKAALLLLSSYSVRYIRNTSLPKNELFYSLVVGMVTKASNFWKKLFDKGLYFMSCVQFDRMVAEIVIS